MLRQRTGFFVDDARYLSVSLFQVLVRRCNVKLLFYKYYKFLLTTQWIMLIYVPISQWKYVHIDDPKSVRRSKVNEKKHDVTDDDDREDEELDWSHQVRISLFCYPTNPKLTSK